MYEIPMFSTFFDGPSRSLINLKSCLHCRDTYTLALNAFTYADPLSDANVLLDVGCRVFQKRKSAVWTDCLEMIVDDGEDCEFQIIINPAKKTAFPLKFACLSHRSAGKKHGNTTYFELDQNYEIGEWMRVEVPVIISEDAGDLVFCNDVLAPTKPGELLRLASKARGLNIDDVGLRSNMDGTSISRIFNGEQTPTRTEVATVGRAIGIEARAVACYDEYIRRTKLFESNVP